MDPDGKNRVNLTHSKAAEGWPAWSPDGKKILYSSDETGTFALYLMDADGKNRRQITDPKPPFQDARAQLSPDGSAIVLNRQDGKTIGIYVLDLGS